jgi:hypothetical protein
MNYANINLPLTFPATKFPQHKPQLMVIKDEIKFLYIKKAEEGSTLYTSTCSQNIWTAIPS